MTHDSSTPADVGEVFGVTITRVGNSLPRVEYIGTVTQLQLQELLFAALVATISNTLAQRTAEMVVGALAEEEK